jgi:CMP-N-acetylneuraminic acid synthetase
MMGTDCIGSYKSNYHSIMTMTALVYLLVDPDSSIKNNRQNFKILYVKNSNSYIINNMHFLKGIFLYKNDQ